MPPCRGIPAPPSGGRALEPWDYSMLKLRAWCAFSCMALFLVPGCSPRAAGPAHTRVIARDYAFGFPHSLPAGPTAFRLINEGTVNHEVQIYRFTAGLSPDSALRLLATDQITDRDIDPDGGVLIAAPSDSTQQELLVMLRPGEVYALECAFRNAADQPKHRDLGMVAVFTVE